MKSKIFVLLIIAAFLLSVVGMIFADTKKSAKANQLAVLLPASDMVVTMDAQRVFNQALPQIFSANQENLAEINSKIDDFKTKTGLDARQFQQIAIGISTKQISAKEVDYEPFVLARGTFNADSLVAVAKFASNGKYREEKVAGRTVYVFTTQEIIEKNKPQASNSMIDRLIRSLTKEIALTTYDNNTLAFGSLARVREAFQTKTRVGNDVLSLANRNPNAIMNFGAKFPNGLSNLIVLENDELGKSLDGIRQVSGAMNIENGGANLSLAAKTAKEDQAQSLHNLIEGLRFFGNIVRGQKGEDKKVYARMIDGFKINRSGSELSFDLQVPQADIDILLGKK